VLKTRTGQLTRTPLSQANAHAMIRRRAGAAGNHGVPEKAARRPVAAGEQSRVLDSASFCQRTAGVVEAVYSATAAH
jgi:hypothetical protein